MAVGVSEGQGGEVVPAHKDEGQSLTLGVRQEKPTRQYGKLMDDESFG